MIGRRLCNHDRRRDIGGTEWWPGLDECSDDAFMSWFALSGEGIGGLFALEAKHGDHPSPCLDLWLVVLDYGVAP